MVRLVRRHVARRGQDEGIALVVAIALVALVAMVMATVVAVAIYESAATGRDRDRAAAVQAAELALDTYMAQIDGGPVSTLPCGTGTSTVKVGPETFTIETRTTYLKENGSIADTSTHVTCDQVKAGTRAYLAHVIATAHGDAAAGQQPVARTAETLLSLTPVYTNSMNKAIYGDSGISFANHVSLYGEGGQPNADLYTNGNVKCQNNQEFQGSIYAQGSVSMSNSCRVAVDVHAGTEFRADNPSVSINGRVLVANGNATINAAFHLGQQMLVSGHINAPSSANRTAVCGTSKCFEGATVPAVPHEDFPQMTASSAAIAEWQAAGYSRVVTYSGSICNQHPPNPYNGKADWVAYDIFTNFANGNWNSDTIVISHCPQKVMYQGLNLTLPHNLVLFSDAGIVFSNNTVVESNNGTHRNLYLIQPYDAVSVHPCTNDGISLDNQVTVKDEVDVLLYSPCSVRKANNTTHYGQIYSGGNAQIDNKLTMYYRPLPVFGLTDSSTVASYAVDILYKRETTV